MVVSKLKIMVYLTLNIYMPYEVRKKISIKIMFSVETDIIDTIILLSILITYIIDVMIIIK